MQQQSLTASLRGMLSKKRKGDGGGNIIISLVCLLAIMTVFFVSIHFAKILEVKRGLNQMGRDSILLLETQGELTSKQLSEINTELSGKFGDYTITYNGDNQRKAYGSPVSIKIEVHASVKELGLAKVHEYIQDIYDFTTEYSSISKAKV